MGSWGGGNTYSLVIRSQHVAQAGLALRLLLPLPPEDWAYKQYKFHNFFHLKFIFSMMKDMVLYNTGIKGERKKRKKKNIWE